MYYIDELNSLTKTIDLSRDELDALHKYSDGKVHYPMASEPREEYLNDKHLRSALKKMKDKRLFMSYINLLKKYSNVSFDEIL